jgi:hypothetical protein
MPQTTIKVVGENGELLGQVTEYICDWEDGCPNPAQHVKGFSRELGLAFALCNEHNALYDERVRLSKVERE